MKKLLKALWNLLGDDRVGLVLAGGSAVMAVRQLSQGDTFNGCVGVLLALLIGVWAWRDLSRDLRKVRP